MNVINTRKDEILMKNSKNTQRTAEKLIKKKKNNNEKKHMDTTLKVICAAVKASLFNISTPLPDNINWDDVFAESKKQAIESIVRDGVKRYLPDSLASKWKLCSIHEISFAVQLLEAQKGLCVLLENYDIKYLILKGAAVAIYYPEPYIRSMGDVDFWVPGEQFNLALGLLKKDDFIEIDGSDERHIKLKKEGFLFEMHRFFDSEDGDKPIDGYIQKAKLVRGEIREVEFWMLPTLENGLVLLVHLCQHLYEGLGLRQVLDWMMYCDKCLDEEGWQKFRPHAKELGVEKLALVTTRLCVKYFGLQASWSNQEDDEAAELFMDNLIQSGNFGKIHNSGQNVERVVVNVRKQGVFHYLQKAGEFNWQHTLQHKPYLRPFAWIYQIGRYSKQIKNTGHTVARLQDDMRRSNERYELMKILELL